MRGELPSEEVLDIVIDHQRTKHIICMFRRMETVKEYVV